MKYRKLICLILALALIALSGCGNEPLEKEESAGSNITEEKEYSAVQGEIAEIAKYGSPVLTVSGKVLSDEGYEMGDILKVSLAGKEYSLPYVTDYSDVEVGEKLLRNKGDILIVAVNMGSFCEEEGIAEKLKSPDGKISWKYAEGIEEPVKVEIEMGEKGGYLKEWNLRHLERSNKREDYPLLSDRDFANFREIKAGEMRSKKLFRSSDPASPSLGRNTFADKAAREENIKTVINLSTLKEEYEASKKDESTYYDSLEIHFLGLNSDFESEDFKEGIKKVVEIIGDEKTKTPILIHCTEGKDRAGIIAAILECFMGGSYEEVKEDYLKSYYNYFYVEPNSEKAEFIAERNIKPVLESYFSLDDIEKADLQKEAEEFLLSLGLDREDLDKLREKLI